MLADHDPCAMYFGAPFSTLAERRRLDVYRSSRTGSRRAGPGCSVRVAVTVSQRWSSVMMMTTFGGDAAFATVAGAIKDLPARGEQEVSNVAEGARRPIPACLRCVSCSARRRPDDFGT